MSTLYTLLSIAMILCIPAHVCAHDLNVVTRDCSTYKLAAPFEKASRSYQPKYKTVAHELLEAERDVASVTPAMYLILDTILDEAHARLQPIPSGLSDEQYDSFAIQALTTIDCILVSHRFVYPGRGLVQLLADGLEPTVYSNPAEYARLMNHPHNRGREPFMAGRMRPFYVVDCDIASFLYLAIADEMSYPVHMVDVPMHNFIRWERGSHHFIDFETMDGVPSSDEYYIANLGIPNGFIGKGGILTSMTKSDVLAYHLGCIGVAWSWKRNTTRMVAAYENALDLDPRRPFAANNLAWFYATVPDLTLRDGIKAIKYAQIAVGLVPDADKEDTLACAYGQNGEFDKAVAMEEAALHDYRPRGSNLDEDLARLKAGQTCLDPDFGKDPSPFRPSSRPGVRMTIKNLMRLH